MDLESTAEPAIGIGPAPVTGWFNFHFADERWEWSPEVKSRLGRQMAAADVPKSSTAVTIDARGRTRDVIVLAEHLFDDTGAEVGLHGFYVDVTPISQDGGKRSRDHHREVSEAVAEIAESRGPIEHAKGMLMLAYRIDEQQAFDLLKWRSQEANVKLRALAVQLVADLAGLAYDETLPSRSSVDQLLLTAHLRIVSSIEIAS